MLGASQQRSVRHEDTSLVFFLRLAPAVALPLIAGGFAGQGVAAGAGALSGQQLRVTFQGIPVPANQPCAPGPALGADSISGTFFTPGAQ